LNEFYTHISAKTNEVVN